MKEELGTPGAVIGAVVMSCLFGGLALAIYPGWSVIGAHVPPFEWSDLMNAEAAAALGSCAAAIVAIWIALRQSSKEARRDMEVARLYASSMIAGLRHTLDQVSSASTRIAFADQKGSMQEAFSLARNQLDVLAKRPSIDELKALAPLPGQCGSRIARAFDQVAFARERLNEFLSLSDNSYGRKYMANQCRTEVWKSLQQAVNLLRVALPEVEKAADAGSPFPSAEELHGPWHDSDF